MSITEREGTLKSSQDFFTDLSPEPAEFSPQS